MHSHYGLFLALGKGRKLKIFGVAASSLSFGCRGGGASRESKILISSLGLLFWRFSKSVVVYILSCILLDWKTAVVLGPYFCRASCVLPSPVAVVVWVFVCCFSHLWAFCPLSFLYHSFCFN